MLQLAGADMDTYTPVEWQALAHATAAFLQGSEITLGQQRAPCSDSSGDASVAPVRGVSQAAARATIRVAASPPSTALLGPTNAGSLRLRLRRWVQTQQALLSCGRLSEAQVNLGAAAAAIVYACECERGSMCARCVFPCPSHCMHAPMPPAIAPLPAAALHDLPWHHLGAQRRGV